MKGKDRVDHDTAKVADRYLGHLVRSQDHRLTSGDTVKLNAARRVLDVLQDRIKNDIEP